MPQRYHDFAKKIWEKFKLVRREIANATSALWSKLVPQNQLPSGRTIDQVVEDVRKALFNQWSMEPTSKASTLVYCKISIDSDKYARAHSHTVVYSHTAVTKIGRRLGGTPGGLWGRLRARNALQFFWQNVAVFMPSHPQMKLLQLRMHCKRTSTLKV